MRQLLEKVQTLCCSTEDESKDLEIDKDDDNLIQENDLDAKDLEINKDNDNSIQEEDLEAKDSKFDKDNDNPTQEKDLEATFHGGENFNPAV